MQPDIDWIIEGLCNFYLSPLWKVPLSQYVDDHCSLENEDEIIKAHKEFVEIKSKLIHDFINDIQITEEEFNESYSKASYHPATHQFIGHLNRLNDPSYFKKILVKRNNEINERAAFMAQNPQNNDIARNKVYDSNLITNEEQKQIKQAIKLSILDDEQRKKEMTEEELQLQEALRLSKLEYDEYLRKQELEKESALEKEKEKEKEKNKNVDNQNLNTENPSQIFSEEKVELSNTSQFSLSNSQANIASNKFNKSKAHSKLFGALNNPKAGESLSNEEIQEDNKGQLESVNKKNNELISEGGKPILENESAIMTSSLMKNSVKKSKIKIIKREEIKKEDQISKQLKEVKYAVKHEKVSTQYDKALLNTKEIKSKDDKVFNESPEEIKERFKKQRDLILKMEKEERERQLAEYNKNRKIEEKKEDVQGKNLEMEERKRKAELLKQVIKKTNEEINEQKKKKEKEELEKLKIFEKEIGDEQEKLKNEELMKSMEKEDERKRELAKLHKNLAEPEFLDI